MAKRIKKTVKLEQYFDKGNAKLSQNTLVFNLPEGKTCMQGLSCHEYCYGNKCFGKRAVQDKAREKRWELSKRDDFVDKMNTIYQENPQYKVTRFHSWGDIYNLDYLGKIYAIATLNPTHSFYLYSKRTDILTSEIVKEKPDNLIMIYSYDGINPDIKDKQKWLDYGFDKVAIVYDGKNIPSYVKKESCNAGNMTEHYCGVSCTKCIKKNSFDTIFLKKH